MPKRFKPCSVYAEFAGTVEDAKTFAKQHGLSRPNHISDNGLPYISKYAKTDKDLETIIDHFIALGWDRHSLLFGRPV